MSEKKEDAKTYPVSNQSFQSLDNIQSMSTFDKEIQDYVDKISIEENKEGKNSLDLYPGTSEVEYDYLRERQTPHASNLIETTAHLVKGCLGAGVLGIHEAFMKGGILASVVGTFIIGILVAYIMLMLVRLTHKMYAIIRVSRLSYADVAEATIATSPIKKMRKCKKIFRYTVDLFLFIEMFGTCCIFELMTARTVKQAVEDAVPEWKTLNYSLRTYVLITALPFILISFILMVRTLKVMVPITVIAGLVITIIAFVTIMSNIPSPDHLRQRLVWRDHRGFFTFLGTLLFTVQGVTITLPLENNMKSPHHFATVMQFGMSFVVIMIAVIGFFGYWAFGEQCETPVILNMPTMISSIVLQFFLAILMIICFALHFWIAFRIIWYYLSRRHKRKKQRFAIFYKTILVILITALSVGLPYVNAMISFIGAVVCSWIVFIFPPFIDILVTWRSHKRGTIRWRLIRNIMFMMLGGVICIGRIVTYIV